MADTTTERQTRRHRRTGQLVLVAGALSALLGVLLEASTVIGIGAVPEPLLATHLFLFGATGTALVFAGLLLIYVAMPLGLGRPWAWAIARGTALFLLLIGLGASAAMPEKVLSYLLLAVALLVLVPVAGLRGGCSEATSVTPTAPLPRRPAGAQ